MVSAISWPPSGLTAAGILETSAFDVERGNKEDSKGRECVRNDEEPVS